jgi:hypothetical protein
MQRDDSLDITLKNENQALHVYVTKEQLIEKVLRKREKVLLKN